MNSRSKTGSRDIYCLPLKHRARPSASCAAALAQTPCHSLQTIHIYIIRAALCTIRPWCMSRLTIRRIRPVFLLTSPPLPSTTLLYISNCTHKFDISASDPCVRFFGHVRVGGSAIVTPRASTRGCAMLDTSTSSSKTSAVPSGALALLLPALFPHYTHLVFATGAPTPCTHPLLPSAPGVCAYAGHRALVHRTSRGVGWPVR
ncbi:hypothetical protein JB92DRAFT_1590315 [Gautieria morchelliformis]|nr:hypothetical protein JB92DRAFT_1590315 [Gautieria morchelliformis]